MSPSASILIHTPAKINWTLDILGKREDGFHEVDTLMQAVSLYDTLLIERRKRVDCEIHCLAQNLPTNDQDNLIWRAWDLMRREYPKRVGGLRVRMWKRIPVGAGLGGGSSNAAATLTGINKLYRLRLGKARLAELGARLGSDVPFFISGGMARAQGRGEIVVPVASRLPAVSLVIVYPGFASPTPEAYRKLRAPKLGRKLPKITKTQSALTEARRGNLEGFRESLHNAFDVPLTKKNSRYLRLKKRMTEAGLRNVMLSGSGSACFGLAASKTEARDVAEKLRKFYPECRAVRTIRGARGASLL